MVSRYSKKREAILKMLAERNYHPTAEDLYLRLKKDFPKISFATVYRNLDTLCTKGIISKIDFGTKESRYEGNLEKHFHFECDMCKKIYDVSLENSGSNYINLFKRASRHTIKDYSIRFYGVCYNCKK